jgi:DNA-directed DNA polymerase III PolC
MFLNCKTYFSFRYGTYSVEELVGHAASLGHTSIALTNINNTCGIWDFAELCRDKGIRPVLGTEIRDKKNRFQYILLARNTAGFGELNHFLSTHLELKLPFPKRPEATENLYVIYPLGCFRPAELNENELIGVQPTEATRLFGKGVEIYPKKYVVRHPVTFKKEDYNLHRLLRAIDENIVLSKQEPGQISPPHERFVPTERIEKAFELYPFIVENTRLVMEDCHVELEFHTDKNKKHYSASSEDDRIFLEKLALEGMRYRYGSKNKEAERRVRKELKVIHDLGFNAYFLITYNIILYAQSRGFPHVGRGSGANSIVAYCLKITDVDPIKLDLYFERFLNKFRTSPPDFDIDFSWTDRDEVIDYVFKSYGKDHVALLGMYTTFQHQAIVRELGKVFGLAKTEMDSLLRDRDATFQEDSAQRLILKYSQRLINFPNHLSIHPGGMLISEEPMRNYCATIIPPKGFVTSQLDMFAAEKVGLHKLDILSQRGLGSIKETIWLVKLNKGIDIDIHDIEKFIDDPKLAEQIRSADTIGCFYIESPAMRQLLTKLRCDNYITLVAASSIIRPGVSSSGMMQEYIWRYNNPGKFKYLHPVLEEHLKETYGVMVYQEDVIKIAHHYAGLDMAEADILRRAMSGKYRGDKEMRRLEDQFFAGAKALGRPKEVTAEVWRQIRSFGGYSFSKAHSASFAVESYQTLYLKTYYPMEYMVGVINNFGGFYSTELYFHELKKAGATVHLPCVNHSEIMTNIKGSDVFTGLVHILGLNDKLKETIIEERTQNGHYADLADFIERTNIGEESLHTLINIGALRFTGLNKKELSWHATFLKTKMKNRHLGKQLFKTQPIEYKLPPLTQYSLEDAIDEIELLGFTMCNPFDIVDDDGKYVPAADLVPHLGQEIVVLGYLIEWKPVHTKHGKFMFFGTFIDAAGNWLDTVHFPNSASFYPLQGVGYYRMYGTVIEEFGQYSLNVGRLEKVGIKKRSGQLTV